MKKSSAKKSDEDDLRNEYGPEFFRNMTPNRFANRPKLGRIHTSTVRAAAKRSKKRGSQIRPIVSLRAERGVSRGRSEAVELIAAIFRAGSL